MEYTTLISTVGFPITAFFMMYYFATRSLAQNTAAIQKLEVAIAQMWERQRKR